MSSSQTEWSYYFGIIQKREQNTSEKHFSGPSQLTSAENGKAVELT